MIQEKINTPIFITGIERSGSTLMARIINMCGAFVGETTKMSENTRIKMMVDTYYHDILRIDPRGQFPLPTPNQMLIPSNWKSEVTSILERESYRGNQPWMYKNSRIAQLWPIWNRAYPQAKWIIVRRRTGDVVDSCIKTGFMNAYEDTTIQKYIGATNEREGWLWWIHEQEKIFIDIVNANVNYKIIWPERMLDGNFDQIHEMLDWLELPWNTGIISLLETTLIKSKK